MVQNYVYTPIPYPLKFAFGGMAGCAAVCVTHPLDLIKNRMQMCSSLGNRLPYMSMHTALVWIARTEGILSLYNGLSAALLRQATYSTARFGIYTVLFEKYSKREGHPPGYLTKMCIGCVAGGCAGIFGTPAEVSLARMTSDGRLPLNQQRKYKHAFNALLRIVREEGATTLWRGCLPTISRAMLLNAVNLGTYSQVKQYLIDSKLIGDNIYCHFTASMTSGLATAIVTNPVDLAKTRIQNMLVVNGLRPYRNVWAVWAAVVKMDGIFGLWKGFTPYYLRIGPHTLLTLVFLEQLNTLYCKYILNVEKGNAGL